MIGTKVCNQLLHPHVGNLAKQRVGYEFERSDAVKVIGRIILIGGETGTKTNMSLSFLQR
jgi:hypothetical protein